VGNPYAVDSARLLKDRYRLGNVVGRGGMGVVWLATDELLDRKVAVKEVRYPPGLADAERDDLRRRTLREARTTARLSHPNVVGLFDIVEAEDRPWIVMEFIPSRSLAETVREDGPLSPERAAEVGLQLLEGLCAAHAAGVLHRDVKPGNVLLGEDGRVVLGDFGIATAKGGATVTSSGVLIGSPSYMAPERARGGDIGSASDLWSLGATLYTAVEGHPPFDRDSPMAILAAVVTEDPDPPHRAGPLWPLIRALLQRDPEVRPGPVTVERMLREVTESTNPAPAEPLEPAGPSPRRAARTQVIPVPVPPEDDAEDEPDKNPADPPNPSRESPADAGQEPFRPRADAGPESHRFPVGAGREASSAGEDRDDPEITGRQGWPWRGRAVLAAAVVLVAVAALLARHLLAGGPPKAVHGRPPATPAPVRSPTTPKPTPSSALPDGYRWYHDRTKFSIGVPDGWTVSHRGHYLYVDDPKSARYLIVDQTGSPKSDPLKDWREQERNRTSSYPGYHRIRLESVRYPQAKKAADWEFTYDGSHGRTHILNRNVLVNGRHAYALYWSAPQGSWTESRGVFDAFAATFRPATT
jgi:serine/threonine protein kinase